MESPPQQAASDKPTTTASAADNAHAAYECEICLSDPTEPVVTFCGHLYCWPCLYRWMRTGHNQCPVCKGAVSETSVIPLYGRGRERVDPRTRSQRADADSAGAGAGPTAEAAGASAGSTTDGHAHVPSRPAGQRVEAPQHDGAPWAGGGPGGGGVQFTAGFGFFPSLFGLQFQTAGLGRPRGVNAPVTPEEAHQLLLERVMMGLGFIILFFLLFL